MNITMDVREKLVELLKDAQIASVDKCHTYEECKSCPNNGQGVLCRVPFSVDYLIAHGVTMQEWISVSERLPAEEGEVLLYDTEYKGICMGEYCKGNKIIEAYWFVGGHSFPVAEYTHWMPLPDAPQPPKGE